MKPIADYLENLTLPEDKVRVRKIRLRAARFTTIKRVLFRKLFSGPLLRCVLRKEARMVLKAIHFVVCVNHSRRISLAHKAITTRYFWPYMMGNAQVYVKNC